MPTGDASPASLSFARTHDVLDVLASIATAALREREGRIVVAAGAAYHNALRNPEHRHKDVRHLDAAGALELIRRRCGELEWVRRALEPLALPPLSSPASVTRARCPARNVYLALERLPLAERDALRARAHARALEDEKNGAGESTRALIERALEEFLAEPSAVTQTP